jgi:hypothetical protein
LLLLDFAKIEVSERNYIPAFCITETAEFLHIRFRWFGNPNYSRLSSLGVAKFILTGDHGQEHSQNLWLTEHAVGLAGDGQSTLPVEFWIAGK